MCGSFEYRYSSVDRRYSFVFENGIVFVLDLIDRGYTVNEAIKAYLGTLNFLNRRDRALLGAKLYSYLMRNPKESRAEKRMKIAIEVLKNLMEETSNKNIKTMTLIIIEELKNKLENL